MCRTSVLLLVLATGLSQAYASCDDRTPNSYAKSVGYESRLLSIPQLRTESFSLADKELRIWSGFGGTPNSGRSISNRNGKWKEWYFSSSRPIQLVQKDLEASVGESVWNELETGGMFSFPDDCEFGPIYKLINGKKVIIEVTDGTSYLIEYKISGKYRAFRYWNPDSRPEPEAREFLNLVKKLNYEYR